MTNEPSVKLIPITKGYSAIVDADDYEWLSQWKWHFSGNRYAARRVKRGGPVIYMHRLIANTPDDMKADHINGNGLDNRRTNLRNVTNSQNSFNKSVAKNNTTGVRGVSFYKDRPSKKWRASIMIDNRSTTLGYFDTLEEAAACRRGAEEILFGEFRHPVTEGHAPESSDSPGQSAAHRGG